MQQAPVRGFFSAENFLERTVVAWTSASTLGCETDAADALHRSRTTHVKNNTKTERRETMRCPA